MTNVALGKRPLRSSECVLLLEQTAIVAPREWLQLDLEMPYPLSSIVIHRKEIQGSFIILVSTDASSWREVQRMPPALGDGANDPLVVALNDRVYARFVRIEGAGHDEVDRIDVFVSDRYVGLSDIFGALGVSPLSAASYAARSPSSDQYRISRPRKNISLSDIEGLTVERFGRLGNNVIQLINAYIVAKRLRVPLVRYVSSDILHGRHEFITNTTEIEFCKATHDDSLHLVGKFFFARPFDESIRFNEPAVIMEAVERVRTILWSCIPPCKPASDREIHLHFRGGDVFAGRAPPAPRYVQPPLAFYIAAVDHAIAYAGVDTAVLVFEDKTNPCIAPLLQHLEQSGLKVREQSGDLTSDFLELLSANIIVASNSSFAEALALLSTNLRRLYSFGRAKLNPLFDLLPILSARGMDVVVVNDKLGKYPRMGEWDRTPEQIRLMTEYPRSALSEPSGVV